MKGELTGIILRAHHHIDRDSRYAELLAQDSTDNSLEFALNAIEDAIAGLALLHIQLRRDHK